MIPPFPPSVQEKFDYETRLIERLAWLCVVGSIAVVVAAYCYGHAAMQHKP